MFRAWEVPAGKRDAKDEGWEMSLHNTIYLAVDTCKYLQQLWKLTRASGFTSIMLPKSYGAQDKFHPVSEVLIHGHTYTRRITPEKETPDACLTCQMQTKDWSSEATWLCDVVGQPGAAQDFWTCSAVLRCSCYIANRCPRMNSNDLFKGDVLLKVFNLKEMCQGLPFPWFMSISFSILPCCLPGLLDN